MNASDLAEPVSFAVGAERLRGILHPAAAATDARTAVIFLHGWSGCRMGPHRMFVKTARRLAERGFVCLRFDFRGRGESDGDTAAASIRSMTEDARQAAAHALERGWADRVVLLGICSGAKAAIGAALSEPRVRGLALWSGEALGPLRDAGVNTRKFRFALADYARKLARPETWLRLLRGQVNTRMVGKALVGHETPDATERRDEALTLERFRSFRHPLLYVYGSHDPATRVAASRYQAFCAESGIAADFHEIPDANHSFYSLDTEARVMDITVGWMERFRA